MTLMAELRYENRMIDVKHGTRIRLERECAAWCNKRGRAAVIKRLAPKPPVVLAEFRHDGSRLHVKIIEDD